MKAYNIYLITYFVVSYLIIAVVGSQYPGIVRPSDRKQLSHTIRCRPSSCQAKLPDNTTKPTSFLSHFDWKLSVAGGLAGGITNSLLIPIDTLKTMRQADPTIKSIRAAFLKLQSSGMNNIFSGLLPAFLGSIPSSALYFGSYETAKSYFYQYKDSLGLSRPMTHVLAAISGNLVSSVIFVPKDVIKQQLQAYRTDSRIWLGVIANSNHGISATDVIKHIFKTKGMKGFYPSYRATLLRNIPSAVVRLSRSTDSSLFNFVHRYIAEIYSI
jgi:hypothetical protein